MEIDRLKTSTTLSDLSSQSLYNIKVVAVYDEGESLPINTEAVTRKFSQKPYLWLFLPYVLFNLCVLQYITEFRWKRNLIYLRNVFLAFVA